MQKPQVIGWFSTEDDEYTWYPELNPFSYSHQISILPTHIALTLATPQGSSSASQRQCWNHFLGSVV